MWVILSSDVLIKCEKMFLFFSECSKKHSAKPGRFLNGNFKQEPGRFPKPGTRKVREKLPEGSRCRVIKAGDSRPGANVIKLTSAPYKLQDKIIS